MRLSLAGLGVLAFLVAPAANAQPAAVPAAGPAVAVPASPAPANGAATAMPADAKQLGVQQADVKQVGQYEKGEKESGIRTLVAIDKGWSAPDFAQPITPDLCAWRCRSCEDYCKGDVKQMDVKQVGQFAK